MSGKFQRIQETVDSYNALKTLYDNKYINPNTYEIILENITKTAISILAIELKGEKEGNAERG